MAMNRKGVFFSLTALLVVASLFVLFSPEDARTVEDSTFERIQDITQDRAQLEEQILPIILRAYTRQALDDLANKTIQDGGAHMRGETKITNNLADCLGVNAGATGVKCGNTYNRPDTLLTTLNELEEQYHDVLQHDVSIRVQSIDGITHISPWELAVEATMAVEMNDTADIARYHNTRTVATTININGLIDPLSSIRRGEIHRIKRDTSTNWTDENFSRHARRGTYTYNPNGTGYLDRLADNANPSQWGIQSLIPSTDSTLRAVDWDDATYPANCLTRIDAGGPDRVYLHPIDIEFYRQFWVTETSRYDPGACKT